MDRIALQHNAGQLIDVLRSMEGKGMKRLLGSTVLIVGFGLIMSAGLEWRNFLLPYVSFLIGCAYSLQQTLEGLDILSSSFLSFNVHGEINGAYWSPGEAVALPLMWLTVLTAVLAIGFCLAGYCLARQRGLVLGLLMLLLPGILSVSGLWPAFSFVPDVYHVGSTGSLGSPWGTAALLILAVLSGWTLVVIATDVFNLREKFRQYYDHIWFATAIFAGIFFVADSYTEGTKRDLAGTVQGVHQVSAYLLNDVRQYDDHCLRSGTPELVSCQWASTIQQQLLTYVFDAPPIFVEFGPRSELEIYALFGQSASQATATQIKQELRAFNDSRCPVVTLGPGRYRNAPPSRHCLLPPSGLCSGVSPTTIVYAIRNVAIANECAVPTLVRLRLLMERDSAKLHSYAITKHWRHLLLVLLAVLAGGKIANATARAHGIGEGAHFVQLAKRIISQMGRLFRISGAHFWSKPN